MTLRNDVPAQQEPLFLGVVDRLVNHRAERRALHLRLSELRPYNRRDHHLRIVIHAFENVIRRFEGQIFRLRNDDLIIMIKGGANSDLEEVVNKIKLLFNEDPLIAFGGAESGKELAKYYDLELDFTEFHNFARRAKAAADKALEEEAKAKEAAARAPGRSPVPQRGEKPTLDPEKLGRLEGALRTMDLSNMIQRQAICVFNADKSPRRVFNEIFVSIQMMKDRLLPDVEIAGSNRWLFQHLTEVLDLRMLSVLAQLEGKTPLPASVNINISSILTPEFLEFDRLFRMQAQKTMVFEVQSIDVFADLGTFFFARDFLKERGYRLCLDGLTHLTFPMLDRNRLGLDMQKIQWSPDLVSEVQAARRRTFVESIEKAGANRVILCRCDTVEAINFGQACGITLFQGRYIDRMLAAKRAGPEI